jgi:hypothetical protein
VNLLLVVVIVAVAIGMVIAVIRMSRRRPGALGAGEAGPRGLGYPVDVLDDCSGGSGHGGHGDDCGSDGNGSD